VAVDVRGRRDARVAEDPRRDGEFLAPLEPERRARMPKVVEALAGEARYRERCLESVGDVGSVERLPARRREDVVAIPPSAAGGEPFLGLTCLVRSERRCQLAAESQRPAGSLRLRLGELARLGGACVPDSDRASIAFATATHRTYTVAFGAHRKTLSRIVAGMRRIGRGRQT
jgi:hypothetical protein